jgi:hypothetical protein
MVSIFSVEVVVVIVMRFLFIEYSQKKPFIRLLVDSIPEAIYKTIDWESKQGRN